MLTGVFSPILLLFCLRSLAFRIVSFRRVIRSAQQEHGFFFILVVVVSEGTTVLADVVCEIDVVISVGTCSTGTRYASVRRAVCVSCISVYTKNESNANDETYTI